MNLQNNKVSLILVGVIIILIGYYVFEKSSVNNNDAIFTPEATTSSTTVTTTNTSTETKIVPKTPTVSKPSPQPKPVVQTMTKDGLYVIYYTNGGFSPTTLQIKKGKGVRFINNSDKAMRIFADLQEDKTYSALNQSKTVGRGVTYDFVFNEAGNWAYHNENNKSDRGTVVVVEQ
ncbi:MAG: cupredoxin domain-containing protein [bacterium]|nr:cupredoxin domain-containing protein [bacterium]